MCNNNAAARSVVFTAVEPPLGRSISTTNERLSKTYRKLFVPGPSVVLL